MFLEPGDGVGGLEAVEGSHEVFLPARVALDQLARVVAIVGDITAATAGDADLGEDLGSFFEDEDFFHPGFGCSNGSEKSGGTATDYD